jgi:hypothetical protein
MISKFIPQNVKTEINGKEYQFRPMNLSDQIWIDNEYHCSLHELFSPDKFNFTALIKFAFRLLVDKSSYKPVERNDFDENGVEYSELIGGWKLFMEDFWGSESVQKLSEIVVKAIEAGNPDKKEVKKSDKEGATGE